MVPAGPGRSAPGHPPGATGGVRRDHPAAGFRGRPQLGQDRLGGRDRQRVHPAPGLLLGPAARQRPLVEPGRNRAGGGPVAAPAGVAGGPATGGVPASRPASAAHARAGLRLLAGTGALGLRRPGTAHRPGAAALPRPAFNVFRDGRVCPGSHRFPEQVGRIPESFFQSFFSLTGDSQGRSKQHPDNLQALWEELDGKAEYPVEDLVPQCTVGHAMAVSEGRRGY